MRDGTPEDEENDESPDRPGDTWRAGDDDRVFPDPGVSDDTVGLDPPFSGGPAGWWESLEDDLDDDLPPTAPLPLPPEDRLWRHPSEVANGGLEERSSVTSDGGIATGVDTVRSPASTIALVLAAGLAGAVITGSLLLFMGPRRTLVTERVVERQLLAGDSAFVSAPGSTIDVVAVARSAKPSIVRIETFNGIGTLLGSGSGVVFRDDGQILTNAHVVEGADAVEVIFSDGRRYPADVAGRDRLTDIAVVSVRAEDGVTFEPAVLGSTEELSVGEAAVAIGSPLRLEGGPTVTLGVVSAIGRTLDTPDGGRLYDLVQTDAPIGPGSSGGALLDASGSVIGITTVIAVSDVGAEGLGFATPIEIARDVAADLLTDGEVHHGFLGVAGDDADPDLARINGVPGGAVITEVGAKTPAAAAGLQPGDLVVSVNARPVVSMSALVLAIRRLEPGSTAIIGILRDGERRDLVVILGERPQA